MLAQFNLPEVVDVGAGCRFLTAHLGLMVGIVVGGRLAFMVLRLSLRDVRRSRWKARHSDLVEDADLADRYDLDDAADRRAAARKYYLRRRWHERE